MINVTEKLEAPASPFDPGGEIPHLVDWHRLILLAEMSKHRDLETRWVHRHVRMNSVEIHRRSDPVGMRHAGVQRKLATHTEPDRADLAVVEQLGEPDDRAAQPLAKFQHLHLASRPHGHMAAGIESQRLPILGDQVVEIDLQSQQRRKLLVKRCQELAGSLTEEQPAGGFGEKA